jgi:WD40 repeat protein/Flp pilus assembly protein TadD
MEFASKRVQKLPGYSETQGITVEDMMFSSDGYHLVEFFKDRNNSSSKIPDVSLPKIHFWDYLSERELGITANNSKLLQANLSSYGLKNVILSSDGNKMVTTPRIISPGVSKNCYINFWNLSYIQANSTQEPTTFKEACSANFNPYNNQLAIGGINGDISFYNSNSYSAQKLTEWKAHEGAVENVKFSSDGKRLITIGEDGVIRLWNTQELQSSLPLLPIDKKIESISVSPNGQQIALTDSQGAASLWDVSHQTLTPLPITEGSFTSVIFAPNGKHFAGAKKDNTITIFDVSGKLVYPNKFKLRQGNLKNMIFHPNGQLFIIIKHDKHLAYSIVDFSNNPKLSEKSIGGYPNMGYTFSRNREFIGATLDIQDTRGSRSGTVYLQDLSSGNSITKFPKLNANFTTDEVAFNIDGNLMTITQQEIGKPDGTVMLWDIYANQIVNNFKTYSKAYENKTFKGTESPTGAIKSLSLSADGSTVAILGQDGKVMLWHTGLDELLMQGCQQARNYLATLDEKNSDRYLCDDIPPSTPSLQTTIANSSAPSIVQPSAPNAPSPAPSSNNGQDTPSSSAPANAPARPQNVPSPTPSSNNGQNSYEQALNDRKQASKLNSVDVYINQGLTYHRQGKYKQAISNYSQAIALNPNSDKAYSNRAAAYNDQKDYQKAIADSSKAISLNPTYASAYINRGLAYYHQGNYQQAIADYNKAIELAPGNAIAYNNRGLAYTRLGNQQAAQADKQKAAALSQRPSQ